MFDNKEYDAVYQHNREQLFLMFLDGHKKTDRIIKISVRATVFNIHQKHKTISRAN